jgi:hypothetical protein
MTTYGTPVNAPVLGAQINPNFGVTNAGAPPPAGFGAITPPPLMPLIEALGRAVMPRNADVSSVNGVSCGAQNPTPIADLCSNGAGNQCNGGTPLNGAAGNPVQNGANDQQSFVAGDWTAAAGSATGPTPVDNETLTSAPVSCNTFCSNVALSGTFQG